MRYRTYDSGLIRILKRPDRLHPETHGVENALVLQHAYRFRPLCWTCFDLSMDFFILPPFLQSWSLQFCHAPEHPGCGPLF